jgi:hypothetical protein
MIGMLRSANAGITQEDRVHKIIEDFIYYVKMVKIQV